MKYNIAFYGQPVDGMQKLPLKDRPMFAFSGEILEIIPSNTVINRRNSCIRLNGKMTSKMEPNGITKQHNSTGYYIVDIDTIAHVTDTETGSQIRPIEMLGIDVEIYKGSSQFTSSLDNEDAFEPF